MSLWPEPPVPVPVGSPVCAIEALDHAVERYPVVEPAPRQRLDLGDVAGRQIGPHQAITTRPNGTSGM